MTKAYELHRLTWESSEVYRVFRDGIPYGKVVHVAVDNWLAVGGGDDDVPDSPDDGVSFLTPGLAAEALLRDYGGDYDDEYRDDEYCSASTAMLISETYGEDYTLVARAMSDMTMGETDDQRIARRHGLPLKVVVELRRESLRAIGAYRSEDDRGELA